MLPQNYPYLQLGLHNSAFRRVGTLRASSPSLLPTPLWLGPGSIPAIPTPAAVVPLSTAEKPRETTLPRASEEEMKYVATPPQEKDTESMAPWHYETGKWSEAEHKRFLEAMDWFGNDWRRARAHIGTRSSAQIRSHAQKYYYNLRKKAIQKAKADPRCRGALFVVTKEYWHKPSFSLPTSQPKPKLNLNQKTNPAPSPSAKPNSSCCPSLCSNSAPYPAPDAEPIKLPSLESQLTFTSLANQLQTDHSHCLEQPYPFNQFKVVQGTLNSLAQTPHNEPSVPSTTGSHPSPDISRSVH